MKYKRKNIKYKNKSDVIWHNVSHDIEIFSDSNIRRTNFNVGYPIYHEGIKNLEERESKFNKTTFEKAEIKFHNAKIYAETNNEIYEITASYLKRIIQMLLLNKNMTLLITVISIIVTLISIML